MYCIYYHNIAVRCTKTGIKHGERKKKGTKLYPDDRRQRRLGLGGGLGGVMVFTV